MTTELAPIIIDAPPPADDDYELRQVVALERIADALEALQPLAASIAVGANLAFPRQAAPQAPQAVPQQQAAPAAAQPALGPQQGVSWGGAPKPAMDWVCPVHGAVKIVPAGTSKRTGKPYDAFLACPERGCDEKPPRS